MNQNSMNEKKHWLTGPVATIIGAALTVVGGLVGAYINRPQPGPTDEYVTLVGALYHKENKKLTAMEARRYKCGGDLNLELAQVPRHEATCTTRKVNGQCEVQAYFEGANKGEANRGKYLIPRSVAEVPGHIMACIVVE